MGEAVRKCKRGGGTPLHQRDSNLELFRVVTMLFIIAHHYVTCCTLPDEIFRHTTSARSLFLLAFGAWGKTGINCFLLITGYFMCTSHITVRKFCKILFEVEFYKIIFYFVFLLTGYEQFSLKTMIRAIVPFTNVDNGHFVDCYLLFYLMIPFLNVLLRNIHEKQHLYLLMLLLTVFSIWESIPNVLLPTSYLIWFPVIYLIAAYFRLHPKKCFCNTRLWGLITLCVFGVAISSVIGMTYLMGRFGKNFYSYSYWFVYECNRVLAVALSVSAFLFFKNLRIKQSRFINALGASTFGVLLLHDNSATMCRFLWQDVLDNAGMYASPYMPLHAFGSVIAVFAVCAAIDQVRIHLIERPFFRLWDRYEEKLCVWWRSLEDRICTALHIAS